jgi:hypothetical protein
MKIKMKIGEKDNILYYDENHYICFDEDLEPHGIMKWGDKNRFFSHGKELEQPLSSLYIDYVNDKNKMMLQQIAKEVKGKK